MRTGKDGDTIVTNDQAAAIQQEIARRRKRGELYECDRDSRADYRCSAVRTEDVTSWCSACLLRAACRQEPEVLRWVRKQIQLAVLYANHYALNTTPKAREVCEYWRGRCAALGEVADLLGTVGGKR